MRRPLLLTGLLTAALVTVPALPALAHATFSSPAKVKADTDTKLILDVPNERDDPVHNTGVKMAVPSGWKPLACDAAAPWSCTVETTGSDGRTVVAWVKAADGATAGDETFSFTVHTGPAGKVAFPVVQSYSNGESVAWSGPTGSKEPAPTLEAVAGDTTGTTAASTTATTAAGSSSSTTEDTQAAAGATDDDGGGGSSPLPLILGGLVVLGGLGFVAYRQGWIGG